MEELIIRYGAEVSLIAVSAIFLVGCFKLIFKKQFENVEKSSRKTVYETLSIIIAFGLTALWLVIEAKYLGGAGFTWPMFGKVGASAYGATKVAYSLYENFKLRDLLHVIGKSVVSIFTTKKKLTTSSGSTQEVTDDTKNKVNVI
nr:MAG TPA: hypothetical protein [Caudoviricetes sp.]